MKRTALFVIFFSIVLLMPGPGFSSSLSKMTVSIVPEYLGFQSKTNEKNGIVNTKVVIDGRFADDAGNPKPLRFFLPEKVRLGSVIQIDKEGRYQKPAYTIKTEKGNRSLVFKKSSKRFIISYFIFPKEIKGKIQLDYSFYAPDDADLLHIEVLKPLFARIFTITKDVSFRSRDFSRRTEDIADYPVFEFKKIKQGSIINLSFGYSIDKKMREKRVNLYAKTLPAFVYGSALSYKGYTVALKQSDILNMIPCYCGCGKVGHTSLKDCFLRYDGTINNHAAGCHICNIEAVDVRDLKEAGFSIQEIRRQVERKYQIYGKGTDTPSVI